MCDCLSTVFLLACHDAQFHHSKVICIAGGTVDHLLIKNLPKDVGTFIAETFSVQGVAPMTPAGYREIVQSAVAAALKATGGQVGMNPRVGAVQQSSLHLWNGDGGLHLLPSDFRIRSMDSHTLWRFWLRGAPADGVQPYRLLKAHMLPPSAQLQNQKQQLSRMLHVGSFLQANSGATLGQLRDATALELTSFFDTAWAYLLLQYPAAKKSHSVGTLYKIMHE